MTFVSTSPTSTPSTVRQPARTLREKEADSFRAALAGVLSAALEDALEVGDHPRAVSLINRGFAEGSPQLGCDLLCRAIAVVGAARTWTVQIAPLTRVRQTVHATATAGRAMTGLSTMGRVDQGAPASVSVRNTGSQQSQE